MQLIELESIDSSNDVEVNYNELIGHLSEVVMSMNDEETKSLNDKLIEIRKRLIQTKKSFDEAKVKVDNGTSELAREKQLFKVLTKIESLNKEGKIRGTTKVKIISIIPKLNEYTFIQLSKLEEKLSIY